jgi:hypothetical protein
MVPSSYTADNGNGETEWTFGTGSTPNMFGTTLDAPFEIDWVVP